METAIGILMLLAYIGLVYYTYRGGNIQIGFLIIAAVYAVLAIIGNNTVTNADFLAENEGLIKNIPDALTQVFQKGAEGYGANLVNVMFGAWFGQVILETNIARTIIRKTVELGGDRPGLTMILLSIVCALIFSGIYGAGAVIAIGVIVLPILMSLGIPKVVALFSYIGTIGAALYINPVQHNQWATLFGITETYTYQQYFNWGVIALGIQIVILAVFSVVYFRKETAHAWAAQTDVQPETQEKVPGIALITPVIPVVLLYAFKIPVIVGFLAAGFFAMAVCRKMRTFADAARLFAKNFFDGVVDVAPFMGFLLTVGMFNNASALAAPYLGALLGGVQMTNVFLICIAVALLAPLALFRGPMTLAGAGPATAKILTTLGFNSPFVMMLLGIPTLSMHVSGCFTQSWTAWGIGYTKVTTKDWLRKSVPVCWVCCALIILYTYFVYGGTAF
ncbi:MAG TPA: citrate transporter [Feifaniaceae bacterium]|nr:citrate transporter [Feifaniaceae bacterium]